MPDYDAMPDNSTICARRHVTTEPVPQRMIRTRRALVIIDLAHPQPFCHRPTVSPIKTSQHSARSQKPNGANVTCYGTICNDRGLDLR